MGSNVSFPSHQANGRSIYKVRYILLKIALFPFPQYCYRDMETGPYDLSEISHLRKPGDINQSFVVDDDFFF